MADASERLLKLRPVTFRYKQPNARGAKPIPYGLIAEEVAEVFPELVLLNKDGQPETVAYHVLPALLLNEYQKEHSLNQVQGRKLALLQKQFDAQSVQLANLERLTATLAAANGIDPAEARRAAESRADLSRTVAATQ
jgi:trimeric autotransporter adhesin